MKTTVRLVTSEFCQFLADIKGNPIATVTMVSSQKSKVSAAGKKAIDASKLFKLSEIQVQLGSTYAKRVNNQLKKEGKNPNFTAKLGNVSRVSGCLGKGNSDWNSHMNYAILTPNRNSKGESFYIYDGKKVSKEFIASVFVPSALKQYDSKSQGTDDNIFHLTPKVESILQIVVNGKTYMHIRS